VDLEIQRCGGLCAFEAEASAGDRVVSFAPEKDSMGYFGYLFARIFHIRPGVSVRGRGT
jgi:hypothetical protein